MLRTVWYKIEENGTARSEQIFRALTEKGIPCRKLEQEARMEGERRESRKSRNKQRCLGTGRKERKNIEKIKSINAEYWKETEDLCHVLLLTDDRALLREASQEKIACVGVAGADTSFFEGADLVVEDPEELELRELEDYLCHCHGVPVTIAQTGRLTLREMITADWQVLDRISRQQGMEKARRDAEEDGAFGKERLTAYISSQYQLYGYGLWAVVLTKDDERKENIIGCCGFSEMSENLEQSMQSEQPSYGAAGERPVLCMDSDFQDFPKFSGPVLELQYMLDEAYRRRGYGTEMCRAAISYAYEYLEAKEIWVRVRSDYPEALSFARSLGFRPVERKTKFPSREVYTGGTLAESGNMCRKKELEDTEYVWGEDFTKEHAVESAGSVSWYIVWLRYERPHF